jgi:hypothetical protein
LTVLAVFAICADLPVVILLVIGGAELTILAYLQLDITLSADFFDLDEGVVIVALLLALFKAVTILW